MANDKNGAIESRAEEDQTAGRIAGLPRQAVGGFNHASNFDVFSGIVNSLNDAHGFAAHNRFMNENEREYREALDRFSKQPWILETAGGVLIENKFRRDASGKPYAYDGSEGHLNYFGLEEAYKLHGKPGNTYIWIGDASKIDMEKIPGNVRVYDTARFLGVGPRSDAGPDEKDPIASALHGSSAAKTQFDNLRDQTGDAKSAGNALHSLIQAGYLPKDGDPSPQLTTSSKGETIVSTGEGPGRISAIVREASDAEIASSIMKSAKQSQEVAMSTHQQEIGSSPDTRLSRS